MKHKRNYKLKIQFSVSNVCFFNSEIVNPDKHTTLLRVH